MTKAQLIDALSQRLGQSKQDSERVLDAVLDTAKAALQQGEKLDLRGFGTFKLRESKARLARNPRTGETVNVPAKKVAAFKPSKELAALLNPESSAS